MDEVGVYNKISSLEDVEVEELFNRVLQKEKGKRKKKRKKKSKG